MFTTRGSASVHPTAAIAGSGEDQGVRGVFWFGAIARRVGMASDPQLVPPGVFCKEITCFHGIAAHRCLQIPPCKGVSRSILCGQGLQVFRSSLRLPWNYHTHAFFFLIRLCAEGL